MRSSVAMAVYNGARFLHEQVDSILCQLAPDDELVISYDKSTDNTWEILCDYAARDSRVKLLQNDTPGVIGNFNNALSACTGDYIFISDQDDRWAPDKREKVLAAFTDGIDAVIHNAVHMDTEGKTVSAPLFELYRIRPEDTAWTLFVRPRYSGCTMAFTRKMLDICLPFPPNTDGYDIWMAILCKHYGKMGYVGDILLYHRMHENNVTTKVSRPLSVKLKTRAYTAKELCKRLHRERRKK